MNILGISCFYHDSAACIVRDGEIVAAVQEERFTRKKHDAGFPMNAISYCLKEAGIDAAGLDLVVFYEKPLKKRQRISEMIRKEVGFKGKILFAGHHESHAASAFYPSPFKEAAVLTIDGVGERETASFGVGKGNKLTIKKYLKFPDSLGLLYSAFTYYIGFKVNSGEYKLMGLAAYGKPVYRELILKELINLKADGSFKMNLKYFGYCNSPRMTNRRFDRLFGASPRKPETEITQKHMDIAASIQSVTEEILLKMASHVHKVTRQDKLCLAGGVALNCVGNGRILREGPFKEIWIQPAAGDAGCALGAALLGWYKYSGNKRQADGVHDSQKSSLLGPSYSDERIKDFLRKEGASYRRLSRGDIAKEVSKLIAGGKIVGWFQGRAEFGPRGLGARSIVGDARDRDMQAKMNLRIKYRESFRPFAPSVLANKAQKWFELDRESPYMLLTAQVRSDKRPEVPAITHVDNSARIQTVKRGDNPLYYDMINAFYKRTGCPAIINTSFNIRGEPLVLSPEDAYRCFMRTEMDHLMLGSFLLNK